MHSGMRPEGCRSRHFFYKRSTYVFFSLFPDWKKQPQNTRSTEKRCDTPIRVNNLTRHLVIFKWSIIKCYRRICISLIIFFIFYKSHFDQYLNINLADIRYLLLWRGMSLPSGSIKNTSWMMTNDHIDTLNNYLQIPREKHNNGFCSTMP